MAVANTMKLMHLPGVENRPQSSENHHLHTAKVVQRGYVR